MQFGQIGLDLSENSESDWKNEIEETLNSLLLLQHFIRSLKHLEDSL